MLADPPPLQFDHQDPFLAASLSSIAAVGHRGSRAGLVREVELLTALPLRWHRDHIHWPTGMGAHGVPVEVSLSFSETGEVAFRLLSDLQDHRHQLAGNWRNYVASASRLTGVSESSVSLLMARHMDIDPPNTRTPMYFGKSYASKKGRSSLYFSTVSWPKELVRERFPESTAIAELSRSGPNAPWVHLAGYDFDEAATSYRTKLYAWLDRDSSLGRIEDAMVDAPTASAQAMLDHLAAVNSIEVPSQSCLIQFSKTAEGRLWTRKLYVHAPKWNFDNPEGFGRLVQYLAGSWGADVSKLMEVLSIFAERGVQLLPSGLAVGLSEQIPPAFTLYFVPVTEKPAASGNLREVYERAIRAIAEQANRGWPDFETRHRSAVVSRIRLAISGQTGSRENLLRPETSTSGPSRQGAIEPIVDARETLTCLRLQDHSKERRCKPLAPLVVPDEDRVSPELLALRLLIRLESNDYVESDLRDEIDSLLRQERWGGGWVGPGAELEVTVTVLEALTKIAVKLPTMDLRLAPLISRTIYWLRALPLAREPAQVALWVRGNLLTGDTRSSQSLRRAIEFLVNAQNENGTWPSLPFESASGDNAYLDAYGWLTTALATECLSQLLTTSGEPQ